MKTRSKWIALASAFGLTALCVGAALATGGDQNDPLVTLSYLEQTALPGVVEQVEIKSTARQAELEKALADQIAKYKQEIAALAGSGSAGSVSYTLVTLTSGQTMSLDVGCEVMLRVGSASCVSPSSPGLIDETAASVLQNGGALVQNHLYMMTIEGRGVQATAATTKLLVRGDYTIA